MWRGSKRLRDDTRKDKVALEVRSKAPSQATKRSPLTQWQTPTQPSGLRTPLTRWVFAPETSQRLRLLYESISHCTARKDLTTASSLAGAIFLSAHRQNSNGVFPILMRAEQKASAVTQRRSCHWDRHATTEGFTRATFHGPRWLPG